MSKDFVTQYAKALFQNGSSLEEKTKYLLELRTLKDSIFKDKEIINFFKSFNVSAEDKNKVLEKTMSQAKISKNVVNMIKILTDRNKLSFLDKVVDSYESLADQANGVVRGIVRSSHALSEQQRSEVSSKIESVLKKKVILSYVLDNKVIGGIKAQVGSYTFDDTLQTHLKKLKDQINRSVN